MFKFWDNWIHKNGEESWENVDEVLCKLLKMFDNSLLRCFLNCSAGGISIALATICDIKLN